MKRADWSTLDFVLNLFPLDITQGRRVKRTGNSASVTPAKLFSSAIDKIDNAQGACTLHYFLFLPIYVLVAISEKV